MPIWPELVVTAEPRSHNRCRICGCTNEQLAEGCEPGEAWVPEVGGEWVPFEQATLCSSCADRATELGLAWATAAAATPAGWIWHGVELVEHGEGGVWGDAVPSRTWWGPDWRATMSWPDHCERDDCDHDEAFAVATGDTPAAALEALLVELHDRQLVPA